MQIIVDLDGTICSEEKTYSRSLAQPKPGAVESLKEFEEAGHTIIIYSGRSWPEYEMTFEWLKRNGVPFHQLILGKPIGDVWIDDRALEFQSWPQVAERIRARRS